MNDYSLKNFDKPENIKLISDTRQKINTLSKKNDQQHLLAFRIMAVLTPVLEILGADPAIIVGGHAVELYTSGSYTTADVDLVMIRDDIAFELFKRLGFIRRNRHHYIESVDIPIEIPSSDLDGSIERALKVNTEDGYCYVIGIEDLIIDRMKAAYFWKDQRSLEWASYLMASQFENINWDYLNNAATKSEDLNFLDEIKKQYFLVKENLQ